jgi:hypothetical protein
VGVLEKSKLQTLARRDIRADDGTRWHVREADAHDVPRAPAPACLIFDAVTHCRRVWIYPDGRAELSVSSLLALMDRSKQA